MGDDFRYSCTVPCIMDFPHLFTPKAFGAKGKESGTPKYSANFIFDPANNPNHKIDVDAIKALCVQAARAKWPGRDMKNSGLKFPWRTGEKIVEKQKRKKGDNYKGDQDHLLGKLLIAGRSKYEPKLAVLLNGKVADLDGNTREAHKAKFYSGCEVLVEFNFVAYDGVGDANPDGVTAYLNTVLSLNKGARLASSGGSAAETFRGYIGTQSAEDPTGGEDLGDDLSDL